MKHYGLIGKSLGHSFSKSFFEKYFLSNAIDADYVNLELGTIEELAAVIEQNFSGLNVTIPYKEEIIPFLDEVDAVAREIGAVNTVKIANGTTIGYNTDAFGFHQSIKPFLTNRHERAVIFGTGGASKAVDYVLRSIGVEPIFISRNPEGPHQFGYDEVNEHMLNACKLLVNCTPIGTYPAIEEHLEIPFEFLTADHLVVDLIYNPAKSKLLQLSELNGATILNGESMLKQQALKAWEIWNN